MRNPARLHQPARYTSATCKLLETIFRRQTWTATSRWRPWSVKFIVSSFPELGLAGPDTLSLVTSRTLDSANIYARLRRRGDASHRDTEPVGNLLLARARVPGHTKRPVKFKDSSFPELVLAGNRRDHHELTTGLRRQRPVLLLPRKNRQHRRLRGRSLPSRRKATAQPCPTAIEGMEGRCPVQVDLQGHRGLHWCIEETGGILDCGVTGWRRRTRPAVV